jgi:hypothetical protein
VECSQIRDPPGGSDQSDSWKKELVRIAQRQSVCFSPSARKSPRPPRSGRYLCLSVPMSLSCLVEAARHGANRLGGRPARRGRRKDPRLTLQSGNVCAYTRVRRNHDRMIGIPSRRVQMISRLTPPGLASIARVENQKALWPVQSSLGKIGVGGVDRS